MFVNVAVYRINTASLETFVHRIQRHAETTLRDEEGCAGFEVSQLRDDPAVFVIYEVFRDRAAFDVHAKMPHVATFLKDREAGAWIAERTVYQLNRLFPSGDNA